MPRSIPRSPVLPGLVLPVLVLLVGALLPIAFAPPAQAQGQGTIDGLSEPVRVIRDGYGIPHVYASNDLDALTALGWVHAEDRFFQMDVFRRTFRGTLAELLGPGAVGSDVQLRTLGLGRGAEASAAALPPDSRAWFEAYARGVNSWLARNPLPPEYAALELGPASVRPWTVADSIVIGKAIAFQLSFDLEDIDRTIALQAFELAGQAAGFDGQALFFEDVWRTAPLDETISIPNFIALPTAGDDVTRLALDGAAGRLLSPAAIELARSYRDAAAAVPALAPALTRSDAPVGSNWWMVAGDLTTSGAPILANDPHLGLDLPSIFHEAHLLSFDGERRRPMIVNGVGFAGTPALALGCNLHICWGATTNPLDVTDVYIEEVLFDPATGLPRATRFRGQEEPIVVIPQVFRVNQIGDGVADNLADAGVGPEDGGLTFLVPRRNHGPIVELQVDPETFPVGMGLSVQYAGSGPTREIDAFRVWMRATDLDDFRTGLEFFDVGSQNWGYVDRAGTVAYFTSAEMPLREDLEAGRVDGLPPYFLRDGTGALAHEWVPLAGDPPPGQALPYEILPFEEMPQVIQPAAGWVLNANNDPVGTTLDNNPLNQLRPTGGLYYLSPGYSDLRGGRIEQLLRQRLDEGPVDGDDLAAMQADNALFDAQILVPHILEAFANAQAPGAPAELAELAAAPRLTEAVERLEAWRFTTPTGIREGFDPGDDPANLPEPTTEEIDESVAATIFSVWRGQMIRSVVDDVLASVGLGDFVPGSTLALRAMAHQLESFDEAGGIGASGVDFFPVAGVGDREAARDVVILGALAEALDLLAGDAFAPAFGGSTDLEDYRWGRLHRITFDHPLGGPFDAPPAGGLADVAPELPGVARPGGFGSVDAAAHSTRADEHDEFTFGSGPARRFVGTMARDGVRAFQVIPGGQSARLGSPHYADQLALWLTNQMHPLLLAPGDVQAAAVRQTVYRPPTP